MRQNEFEVKTPTLFNKARFLAGSYALGDAGGRLAGAGYSLGAPFSLGFDFGSASGRSVSTDIAAIGISYSSGLSQGYFILNDKVIMVI